jgi:hypothetical protein
VKPHCWALAIGLLGKFESATAVVEAFVFIRIGYQLTAYSS